MPKPTHGDAEPLSPSEMTISDVMRNFPSPTFRKHQKDAMSHMVEAFGSGKKCVIMSAPVGFGKCIHPLEKVFTRRGLIAMKDVLATDDPNFRTNAFPIGETEVLNIVTKHGYSLRGGDQHRIVVFDGAFKWKHLFELKVGDCVPIAYEPVVGESIRLAPLPLRYSPLGQPPAKISFPPTLEAPLAELLGIYLAEGSLMPVSVHITSQNKVLRQAIKRIAERYNISAGFYPAEVVLYSVHVRHFLSNLVGRGAYAKRVPNELFRAKANVRIAFLRRYFQGDGYRNEKLNVSEFYTVSYEIARAVQLLLLSLGMFSTLAKKKGRYKGRRHWSWRVCLSGSQSVKMMRLLFGIRLAPDSASSWERIPFMGEKIRRVLRECVRRNGVVYRSKAYRRFKTLESYAYNEEQPTGKTLLFYLRRMKSVSDLADYQDLVKVAKTNYLFDYVKSVESMGKAELYEISCKNGMYIAQGFISHNSYLAADFATLTRSFYTTPQLALIDQMLRDPYLEDKFVEIKGHQNYRCYYLPEQSVHVGKCVTEHYPCRERFEVCPYWKQKMKAVNSPCVLMSSAYLMSEGQIERQAETRFGSRELLVLDEAHNIEEQALNHVSLRVTPYTIPRRIFRTLHSDMVMISNEKQLEEYLRLLEEYLLRLMKHEEQASRERGLTVAQAEEKMTIERFLTNYEMYTTTKDKTEWVWQVGENQLNLQPVFARAFMKQLIWKRAPYYIISSATILDPEYYTELIGLWDVLKEDEVAYIQVPSTFPVENRPVIDATVGPLSMSGWAQNMPKAIAMVARILEKEKGNVAVHCYDQETRVLTRAGFKHFQEVKRSDEIATLNPKTGYLEYHRPKRVINYEYEGEMYALKSRNIDLVVTPDHDLWVAPVNDRRNLRKYLFLTPGHLFTHSRLRSFKRHYFTVKRTALWRGKQPGKNFVVGGRRIAMADWLRFLGWYLSEGSCGWAGLSRDYGRVDLSQGVDSPYLSEIEDSIRRLGFEYGKYIEERDAVVHFYIYDDELCKYLTRFGLAPEKFIPSEIKNLHPKWLKILFDTLLKGDGNIRYSKGNYPQYQHVTTSDKLRDDMFEIGLKLGMAVSSYTFDRTKYKLSRIKGRIIRSKLPAHVTTFSTLKQGALICTGITKGKKYARPVKTHYKGTVGCVEVQNHIIYVERNGNACWCGNCHSYRHQRALVEGLPRSLKPRLIVHSSIDRTEKLNEWMQSRGKVFVSVAFNEGQDWKYDVCDAQILLKVPFADLSDKRVKRRLELGQRQWYDNQAMLEAIQAYGRAIRAEDDKARFYVVDGSFKWLVKNCWNYIPDWFKEALPATFIPQQWNHPQSTPNGTGFEQGSRPAAP